MTSQRIQTNHESVAVGISVCLPVGRDLHGPGVGIHQLLGLSPEHDPGASVQKPFWPIAAWTLLSGKISASDSSLTL